MGNDWLLRFGINVQDVPDKVLWPLVLGLVWAIAKLWSHLALASLKQYSQLLLEDNLKLRAEKLELETRLQVRRDDVHRLNGQLQVQQAVIERANEYLLDFALELGRKPPNLITPGDPPAREEA